MNVGHLRAGGAREMPRDGAQDTGDGHPIDILRKSRPNATSLLPHENKAPEIDKRIGELEEVTQRVEYEAHLDPHYHQRRDIGRHYDCARQGPWKPIHVHSAQPHGAADESGGYLQRPVHLQTGPNKQNNKGYENQLDEWDQQPKEIIHGQQPPPLVGSLVIKSSIPTMVGPPVVGPPPVGGGYRKLPHWRGKGGGGRGIPLGGIIHHHRPSGGGQSTQQVVYHANGHQGGPLNHVHVLKPAPSIFGDDEWHHWFYSEEHGPFEHEGEESNQDHKDLSSFHEAEEDVGGGRYSGGDSQELQEESVEEGENEPYRGHQSGEEEESASDEEGSQEQSMDVSGESGQADENKLPCEEEEEEARAPSEGSAEEDLSFLEIMYPPPLPQPVQVITAPALEEPPPHTEEVNIPPVHHGHVLLPVQQAYDTSGYNSSPPKCPYADHSGDPNHIHTYPSQEMLPPKQETRDTRGTMPLPVQQYEVYEINEDAAKDGGAILRPHEQQNSHFEGDVTPELVFGQRIPPKKTVLKFYGKAVPPEHGSPALAGAENYPEEQKDGNAVLRPPPLLLRDPNIKGVKTLMDARRKRRPSLWPTGKQPLKMPTQLLLRPRRIPRRPSARMTVTLQ